MLATIVKNRGVLTSAALIFFSVGADLGFSYWLAEYFKSELHASLRMSSSVVGVYLVGIILGRILVPVFLRRMSARANLIMGLGIALASIVPFILVPSIPFKIALCALYGFGIGPVFPLLVARGTREFPLQSGAVTGVLYGCMSLGGMTFPLLVGALAGSVGIARSYSFCAVIVCGLLVAMIAGRKPIRQLR
jgi:fucose permease